MADSLQTLAGMVKLNDQNANDVGASDVFNDAPLLASLHTIPASNGTNHKYLRQSAAPTVGFRAINAGRDHSVSADELVEIALKLLDFTSKTDKALADSFTRGGAEAYLSRETARHLRAAFSLFEKAIFYGTTVDSGAFSGLNVASTLRYSDSAMVVNAGGDTANSCTSVYMIRSTPDERHVCAIAGNDGKFNVSDAIVQLVRDGDGKDFPAYVVPADGYLGVQVGSSKSVARLLNLDFDHTLTDSLLSQLFELFPEEAPPTTIVMNRKSRGQLQRSRTTYSPTGAEAPLPQEWNGIPIVCTGSILNTEAVCGATP